jgi:hypothetical protein
MTMTTVPRTENRYETIIITFEKNIREIDQVFSDAPQVWGTSSPIWGTVSPKLADRCYKMSDNSVDRFIRLDVWILWHLSHQPFDRLIICSSILPLPQLRKAALPLRHE